MIEVLTLETSVNGIIPVLYGSSERLPVKHISLIFFVGNSPICKFNFKNNLDIFWAEKGYGHHERPMAY